MDLPPYIKIHIYTNLSDKIIFFKKYRGKSMFSRAAGGLGFWLVVWLVGWLVGLFVCFLRKKCFETGS